MMNTKPILPNMLLAGTVKSGTTTLWTYFNKHHDIFMSPKKELWFFFDDAEWAKGLSWYQKQFMGYQEEKIVGEATPLYIYSEKALHRIKKTIPEVKLIFILRNPVERAYSHYWHNVRKSNENVSFEQAIYEDMNGLRHNDLKRGSQRYFSLGCYYRFLKQWFDNFSEQQIHIIIFEEMLSDSKDVMHNLCTFLGIDILEISEISVKENAGHFIRYKWLMPFHRLSFGKDWLKNVLPISVEGHLKSFRQKLLWKDEKPPLSRKTRDVLLSAYKRDIDKLEKLIGKDLSFWMS